MFVDTRAMIHYSNIQTPKPLTDSPEPVEAADAIYMFTSLSAHPDLAPLLFHN